MSPTHNSICMLMTQPFTVLVTQLNRLEYLQAAFDTVQSELKLRLNATKTKMVLFSNTRNSAILL